jgi:hypothetical protein
MKRILTILTAFAALLPAFAQERVAQNKPYIDLRPLHFGILIGINMQDIELENTGPRTVLNEDGTVAEQYVLCEADKWNPGFSVGVLAEMRLSSHFSARLTPTMHFGAKHLKFKNMKQIDEKGRPFETTQDLKNTYISIPFDIKFAAERFNNYRPYIMAGINPMLNLTGKDQDYIKLKRYDVMMEIGLGCDFYLPFFKLVPELKFCYSLTNSLDKNHYNELQDVTMHAYAKAVNSTAAKMIVLTFYFE